MSQQLNRIQNTCPIYDNLEDEVNEILNNFLEDEYKFKGAIEMNLSCILSYADDIRNTAGDLRDTASDIASSKNGEIDELEREKENLEQTISDLENRLSELEHDLSEVQK